MSLYILTIRSHISGIPTCSEAFKQVNRRRVRWRWLMMKMKVAVISQQAQPHSCTSCPLIFPLINAGLLTHQLLWILLACKCSHQMQNSILNISCHLINFGLQKLKRMYKFVMNINIVSHWEKWGRLCLSQMEQLWPKSLLRIILAKKKFYSW